MRTAAAGIDITTPNHGTTNSRLTARRSEAMLADPNSGHHGCQTTSTLSAWILGLAPRSVRLVGPVTERQAGFADEGELPRTSAAHLSAPHALCVEYRRAMADFLNQALALMNNAIGPEVGYEGVDAGTAARMEQDPFLAIRLPARLLMQKARLHVFAVLTANRNSNLHSLAVQMRPALECAGQLVLVFHNLFTAMRPDPNAIAQYLNADYYQTMQRLTRGKLSHDYLLKAIATADVMAQRRKAKRFNESDTVKSLEGGPDWYDYLSEHFHHSNLDALRGPSHLGGVRSNSTAADHLAFAECLGYLAHQMLVMIAHATLSPCNEPGDGPVSGKGLPTPGRQTRRSSQLPRRVGT